MARLRPIESERGTKQQGTEPDTQEEGGNDKLHIVALCHTEIAADLGQRRQHRIGGERGKRHHERDQRHGLAGPQQGPHNRTCAHLAPNALF